MTFDRNRSALWTCLLALLAAGLQLSFFAYRHAVNVLFWDQWDFAGAFFEPHTLWEQFNWQHGPIRQGLGNLMLSLVWGLSYWNVRFEVFCTVGMFVFAAILALLLVKRCCRALSPFDAAVPLLYISPAVWELLSATSNPAHGSLPLLLVTAFALALFIESLPLRLASLVLLDLVCVFTGFGLFLGPLCILVLLAGAWRHWRTRGWLIAHLVAAAAALGVVLLFLRGYTFNSAVDCFLFPWPRPWEYLPFIGFVEGQPIGLRPGPAWRIIPATILGVALLLGALYTSFEPWRRRLPWAEASVLFVLTAFSALFALDAAVGRICLGPAAASASRYAPYGVPALLAVYFILRNRLPPGRPRNAALVCFLLFASVPHLLTGPYQRQAEFFSSGKRRWVECYRQRRDVAACDQQAGFAIYPQPTATHLVEKLEWLEQRQLSFFRTGQSG